MHQRHEMLYYCNGLLLNIVRKTTIKMTNPDTTGTVCLGYGGRIELWLQGVRYGDFNLNNAVAVVDGIGQM